METQENCYKCLLPECESLVFYTKKEIQFECGNCSLFNCIACAGTHPYMSCKDYQQMKQRAVLHNKDKRELEANEVIGDNGSRIQPPSSFRRRNSTRHGSCCTAIACSNGITTSSSSMPTTTFRTMNSSRARFARGSSRRATELCCGAVITCSAGRSDTRVLPWRYVRIICRSVFVPIHSGCAFTTASSAPRIYRSRASRAAARR